MYICRYDEEKSCIRRFDKVKVHRHTDMKKKGNINFLHYGLQNTKGTYHGISP